MQALNVYIGVSLYTMTFARDVLPRCPSQEPGFSVLKEAKNRIFSTESREIGFGESEEELYRMGPRKARAGLRVCR